MRSLEELKKKDLLTTNEFAALVGVTPSTVRRWDKEGRLKPATVTAGNHRRYTQRQVLEVKTSDSDVMINGKNIWECSEEEMRDFILKKCGKQAK